MLCSSGFSYVSEDLVHQYLPASKTVYPGVFSVLEYF